MIPLRKNSLYSSLFIGFLTLILPVNIIMCFYTIYSGHVFTAHAAETYTDYANLVCKQIDQKLNDIDAYMETVYYVNDHMARMSRTSDNNTRYLNAQEINFSANDYLQLYNFPMVFFIHCEGLRIPAVSTFTENPDNTAMSDYIHTISGNTDQPADQFFLLRLNEHYYLSEYFNRNGITLGIIIDLESLLGTLDYNDSNIMATYFCDHEDRILTKPAMTDTAYSALQIKVPLSYAPVSLTLDISRYRILGRLSTLLTLSILMLIISIGCVITYILFIRRKIHRPLTHLKNTICQIQSGAIDSKVSTVGTVAEIADVYDTFNNFMENITNLKMNAYEEKIFRQQIEMQYLRLQLRPHFFLNSLKSIYALAQRQEFNKIQDYVLCLSTHYRFLIYDTTDLIPLKDELLHTQNYIQLQRIGYNLPIHCDVQIHFPMETLQVPTLIIQTFVENSIKYAVVPGRTLNLHIHIERTSSGDMPLLNITIRDNGPGFSSGMLDEINHNEEDFFQKHKGFGNLKRRLAIMYSEETLIYIYNHPSGGATVEILLPYETFTGAQKEES